MRRVMGAALLLAVPVPVAAGLIATVLPAFGVLPAIGGRALSLEPWRRLWEWPGLGGALRATLVSAGLSTAAAVVSAVLIVHWARRGPARRWVDRALALLLGVPHAAVGIGLAFLIAPSGLVARLIASFAGWAVPPDIAIVGDHLGLALAAGLWLVETPFLVLALLASLGQADAARAGRAAAALGHGPWRAWLLVVMPRIWPQMRLPVIAVMAASVSNVDLSLVLGPRTPPTLAVQVLAWSSDPDVSAWFPAAAGSVALAGIVLAGLGVLRIGERAAAWLARRVAARGGRGGAGHWADAGAGVTVGAIGLSGGSAILLLAVWSVAASWRFPDLLPHGPSLRAWSGGLARPMATTLGLGLATTTLALVFAVGTLLCRGRVPRIVLAPLVVPQLAFLFGMQVALVAVGLDGGALALVWAHLVFVLPYVALSLAGPWRALDPRYRRTALCLGASPWRVLTRVTLPMLARPMAAAAAIGFAVSAGLYLPTLFAGAGRWPTLATEALTLASGGDRRAAAAMGLLAAMLPLIGFLAAVRGPSARERRRRGLA